jgi:tetratricopeptide (TPR) repeat protein
VNLISRNRTGLPVLLACLAGLFVSGSALAQAPAPATDPRIDRAVREAIAARESGELDRAAALLAPVVDHEDGDPRPELLLAETLAWGKWYAEAEAIYRRILRLSPASADAQLGLGRVLLWMGRYQEARAVLRAILAVDPMSVDAREELARSWYWSGDFRSAEREFGRVLAADPGRASSTEDLDAIRSSARPGASFEFGHRTDDQPFRLESVRAAAHLFSDPLSRWGILAGVSKLASEERRTVQVPTARLTSQVGIPEYRTTLNGEIGVADLPGRSAELVGSLGVSRRLGSSQVLSVSLAREPLLYNLAALDRAELSTRSAVAWERQGSWLASLRAAHFAYSDDNEGVALDGYVLVPLLRRSSWILHSGVSAAWRDTDESRFRPAEIEAAVIGPGRFAYSFEGIYDPYWTPVNLKEARGVVAASGSGERLVRWNVRLTAGVARDEAVGFGPPEGASPAPSEIFRFPLDREYHPWTAAAGLEWKLGGTTSLALDFEHSRTVDYEANEIRAAVVGRF